MVHWLLYPQGTSTFGDGEPYNILVKTKTRIWAIFALYSIASHSYVVILITWTNHWLKQYWRRPSLCDVWEAVSWRSWAIEPSEKRLWSPGSTSFNLQPPWIWCRELISEDNYKSATITLSHAKPGLYINNWGSFFLCVLFFPLGRWDSSKHSAILRPRTFPVLSLGCSQPWLTYRDAELR